MQGLVSRFAAVASAAVIAIAAFAPSTASAAAITQLEYVQWLVQLAGDTGQFSENSTAGDYANWARGKGMDPQGGWKLNGKLTKQVLAQTLAQFLQLNPGKQKDWARELKKINIDLPESEEISRQELVTLVDTGLQPRSEIYRVTITPGGKGNNGKGNGEDPPPPGWLNPRNPHFGQPQNDENAGPGNGNNRGPSNGRKG
jgi:hypothetical protein